MAPGIARKLGVALDLAAGWVRDGVVPGVAVAVARDGVLIGELYAGKQAAGSGRPVDATTRYSVASITKPVTATAMLRLVERGAVSLDEPARRVVPAFDGADKREVTIRHLLCHTSGLPKELPDYEPMRAREPGFDEIAEAAVALPPERAPGERVEYSNVGYWVLGAGVAAVGGAGFAEVVEREVLVPFGLTETVFDPSPVADRVAHRYGSGKVMNTPYGRALATPTGGLFATARDLARLASIFLAGGVTPEGARVLAAATVDAMTTDQTGGVPGGIDGLVAWSVCAWGLGWEVKGDKLGHWSGDLTTGATFSHPGQGGTLLWADPATGIACAILANRDIATGWAFEPARWARLSNAIVSAVTTGGG